MAAVLEHSPLCHASRSYNSDSDLELPQLSGSQTETENDTPPETPLRSRIPLVNASACSDLEDCGDRILDNLDIIGFSTVPPPAYVFRPLSLVTPNPVRPSLNTFRSYGINNYEDTSSGEDCGYDSEREGRCIARSTFLRFRSLRRGTEDVSPPTCGETKTEVPQTTSYSKAKESCEPVPSPLSTPKLDGKPFSGSSPSLPKRPRHPSPVETSLLHSGLQTHSSVTSYGDLATRYGGDNVSRSMLSSVKDMLAASDLDQAALQRGLASTGVPFRVHKDRRNAATGLGLGWPGALRDDHRRVPTVVPVTATNRHSMRIPMLPKAPEISPIEREDEDMSPLILPLPVSLDSGHGYFDEAGSTLQVKSATMENRMLELEI